MSRRVSLPGADELFRTTEDRPDADGVDRAGHQSDQAGPRAPDQGSVEPPRERAAAGTAGRRSSSGRVRHDEKITVYVTADELLDIEHTRLRLRGDHGLAVDRGRIVREAIHLALEGVDTDGDSSALVRRLREQ